MLPDPHLYRITPVRHLAWMLSAPQLLNHRFTFSPHLHSSESTVATLQAWDEAPPDFIDHLASSPGKRLGLYFEDLYEVLMTRLLGWELVARNLPIRGRERTLGELDFLFVNPLTGLTEHHEIAIKFYLQMSFAPENPDSVNRTLWVGPNARDRLDKKTERLLTHQICLPDREETMSALADLGLRERPAARIFWPGYLFSATHRGSLSPTGAEVLPLQPSPTNSLEYPPDMMSGEIAGSNYNYGPICRWIHQRDLSQEDTRYWVCLNKPHWIGPWHASIKPSEKIELSEAQFRHPRLFANLSGEDKTSRPSETERIFVVPDSWPEM